MRMWQLAKTGDWESAQWKLLKNPPEGGPKATVPVCSLNLDWWGSC